MCVCVYQYIYRGDGGLNGEKLPGFKDIRSGVRGYQIRGTRVSDPGYEGIRSGVRGYQIRGTRLSDPVYEGIRSGVRVY